MWQKTIPHFEYSDENAFVTIQDTQVEPVIVVSIAHKIWFYNMNSGELLGFWMVPDELRTKSVLDAVYDDTAARV